MSLRGRGKLPTPLLPLLSSARETGSHAFRCGQVQTVLQSMDRNGDGMLSARELVGWLLPQTGQTDKQQAVAVLRQVLHDHFADDVRQLFDQWKRYAPPLHLLRRVRE